MAKHEDWRVGIVKVQQGSELIRMREAYCRQCTWAGPYRETADLAVQDGLAHEESTADPLS